MNLLLDPNFSYLFLAFGLMLAVLALISPGTGLLEVGALLLLGLASWGIYNLPINLWAFVILWLGVIPFIFSVRRPGRLYFLIISILAMVIGSAFLFRSEVWWRPAVNPLLAFIVSVLSAGYFSLAARKILEAEKTRPVHDLKGLIGKVGVAKTEIGDTGSVYVEGELWSASSETSIPNGTKVRVVGREGLVLSVEPVNLNGK